MKGQNGFMDWRWAAPYHCFTSPRFFISRRPSERMNVFIFLITVSYFI